MIASMLLAAALAPIGCDGGDAEPSGTSSGGMPGTGGTGGMPGTGGTGGTGGMPGTGGAGGMAGNGGMAGDGGMGGSGGGVVCPDCPPDPALVAPPLDRGIATTVFDATTFLYTGPDPIQKGVAPGTIEPRRAAVLRGQVTDRDGVPVPGVTVSVRDHAELGSTKTRLDGFFDLVVNGGGVLTLAYATANRLPVQRRLDVPWSAWVAAPDVVMIELDPEVTQVALPVAAAGTVARGSTVTDLDGTRRATLLFAPGTTAFMLLPDGAAEPLDTLHMRATEYTVGPNGPQAMPGELPPATAYTYAVDYSVDEALAAGATSVVLSQPAIQYLENFVGFPVGGAAPMGSYDPLVCGWQGSPDGRVIEVVTVTGGVASVDVDGDGIADTGAALDALGITPAELAQVGALYAPGQELWRVPVPHFSPWDTNWPNRFSNKKGPKRPRRPSQPEDDDCGEQGGSIIGVESQVLGERLHIAGTPYSIRYQSLRTPGYQMGSRRSTIQLTDDAPPPDLVGVEVSIDVAGQRRREAFGPEPNQTYEIEWDGKDAYGRPTQGSQSLTGLLTYVYAANFVIPSGFNPSFGTTSEGAIVTLDSSRGQIRVSTGWGAELPAWHAEGESLGGFFLDAHHAYDPAGKAVYLGDGTRRSASFEGRVVDTVAGGGGDGEAEGIPAKAAALYAPTDIAPAPDGSIYIAESGGHRVRKVAPDGTISTVAGSGINGHAGDGGPATSAQLDTPRGIALGPEGSLYIADSANFAIRRVTPDGVISTLAGPAAFGDTYAPTKLAVTPDGTVYVEEEGVGYGSDAARVLHRVRLGECGEAVLVPVAGDGTTCDDPPSGCGDGGPGPLGQIGDQPKTIAAGRNGALIFTDRGSYRVRVLGGDGLLGSLAGNGSSGTPPSGVPSLEATFNSFGGLAVAGDGRVYVADPGSGTVHLVDPSGAIVTIGGGSGGSVEDKAGALTGSIQAKALALHPDGRLLFLEENRVRAIQPVFRGLGDGEIPIPSEDGGELWVFDPKGRHLRTQDALTGVVLRTFGYDAAGRLVTITDPFGKATTIQRDAAGQPTAIVGPYGHTTQLGLDAAGRLETVTNPAGDTVTFGYQGADGLLVSMTDPMRNTYEYEYDGLGRLVTDTDPEGGSKVLFRTEQANAYQVSFSSGNKPVETNGVLRMPDGVIERSRVDPAGGQDTTAENLDGSFSKTYSDGVFATLHIEPDPRWGMQSPSVSQTDISVQGAGDSIVESSTYVSLADPADPLSLESLGQGLSVNGRYFSTDYDAASRTLTLVTHEGRTFQVGLSATGLVESRQLLGLLPETRMHDTLGRVTSITEGVRATMFGYGADGLPSSVNDAMMHTVGFTYDAAGRRTGITTADGRQIALGYDKNSRLASFTPPGRPPHTFGYDKAGRVKSYMSPLSATPALAFTYTPSGQLASITYPDGVALTYGRDEFDRVTSITTPEGMVGVIYDAEARRPTSVTAPSGENLTFSYTGPYLTGVAMTGEVAGTVSSTYDAEGRLATFAVEGGPAVAYGHDGDGLVNIAGDLSLARDPQTGMISSAYIGGIYETYGWNGHGEIDTQAVEGPSGTLYTSTVNSRDPLGRVAAKTEALGAEVHTYEYAYDAAGRLTTVTRDGLMVESYTFDANDNRLTGPGASGTYDDADQLVSYGTKTYVYDASGALASRTDGATGDVTIYEHGRLGSLHQVELPDGRTVQYLVDGLGRRVGKKVDGVLERGFLWAGPHRPAAELDGAGAVVSTFVYATRDNVPDYMVRGGSVYRLVTDATGSVRLVVNTDTGAVAQRIDYDTFGNVLSDTQPGFQPFGFAGGLFDPDTGLVQFGVRDYDPETGRFLARDPILFAGKQANLYLYSFGDPVNFRDPSGYAAYDRCNNLVNGFQQIIGGLADVTSGVLAIGGAVAEAGSGVAAPLAPLTAGWGAVTIVQGADELRRGVQYLAAGDRANAVGQWDANLAEAETAHGLLSVGAGALADAASDIPLGADDVYHGVHPKLGKGLTISTLIAAVPSDILCDPRKFADDLLHGRNRKQKKPGCP